MKINKLTTKYFLTIIKHGLDDFYIMLGTGSLESERGDLIGRSCNRADLFKRITDCTGFNKNLVFEILKTNYNNKGESYNINWNGLVFYVTKTINNNKTTETIIEWMD